MRILVAGATGFIGRHLTRRLLDDAHEVRVLIRSSSDRSMFNASGVEVRTGSISDMDFLIEACRDIDIVYNLIGQIGGPKAYVSDMWLANATAVKNLLEACQGASVGHFVHCSTPGVVGMCGVAPESLPCRPTGVYEQTKYAGEKAVLNWQAPGRAAITIVRPDFIYGPGDLHKLKLFQAIKKRKFALIGGGRSLLHPTYIDDVIDGLTLIAGNEAAFGETINIAGPEPVAVFRLVNTIARLMHVPVPRARVPVLAAKAASTAAEIVAAVTATRPLLTRYQVDFFSRDHASDISKARRLLGYDPRMGLEDGVGRTIEWYRQQGLL